MIRLTNAFIQVRRSGRLTIFLLLFVLLSAATAGLTTTLKGPDLGSLWQSLLFGLLMGWILTDFHFSAGRAIWMGLTLGTIYILLFPANLLEQVTSIGEELIRLGWFLIVHSKDVHADFAPFVNSLQDLFSAIQVIFERVNTWVVGLVIGQPIIDPVATRLMWNGLIMVIAIWAGWAIVARRSALLAACPAILLSVGTLAYAQRTSIAIYLVLGTTLLLMAVVGQAQHQQTWDESNVAYPAKKSGQITNVALFATVGLVMLSALLSSLSIQRIQEWISEHTKPAEGQSNDLAQSLGIIPGATAIPDVFTPVRNPGLPRDHLIGSGPELSQRVVMTVAVKNLASISQAGQSFPLYWRGFTYDIYTGHGWSSSEIKQSEYQPGQSLQTAQGLTLLQTVYPVEDLGGTIYLAGEPVTINLQVDVARRSPEDLFGIQTDASSSYEILSSIPPADEYSLRLAGQVYPDWVRQHFLKLPSDTPDRVKSLAVQLTASQPTPYDRARAIEQYLRTFPYTLDVPRPPLSRDVVDYFLFDLRQGYCDYYASAMVVLARAAGIPARLAIGYASGTYNLNSKRYVVTEADAHSWVEIYFPRIGWIPFEPTASQPLPDRSATKISPSQNPNQSDQVAATGQKRSLPLTALSARQFGFGNHARHGLDRFR